MNREPGHPSPSSHAVAQRIVELASQALCLIDGEGGLVAVSTPVAERLGMDAGELVGRHVREVVESGDAEVEDVLALWRGSSDWRPGPMHLRAGDDREPGLYCRGARLPGTDLVLVEVGDHEQAVADFVALSREVELTNLRRMEAKLHQSLAELEEVNQRLETANAELDHYASMVAHDIRTPFNAISRFAEMLVEDHGDDLPAEAGEMLGAIARLASRGEDVTEALLTLARIGEPELVPGGSDSGAVAERVRGDLDTIVEEAGADVRFGELPATAVQPVHLERILTNLVTNSLKYASPERRPRVVVEGRVDDGRVRFTVTDNGLGVVEDERERIFEPMVRGAAGAGRPGTGVGLSTCRKIVEAYGGTIAVAETPSPGATIEFTLPAATPAGGRPAGSPPAG